jgi:aminoglycoside phosphotransferase (APT) family kinase protein
VDAARPARPPNGLDRPRRRPGRALLPLRPRPRRRLGRARRLRLSSLDGDDPLLRDGAYPADALQWLRAHFAALAATPSDHGLAHGDLAPRNLLSRGRDAVPVLIDWGAATTGPTPWTDARRVTEWALVDGSIAAADHDGFLRAAGLDAPGDRRTLVAMTALHLVDTSRWAREQRPDLYAEYAARCRAGLERLAATG